MARVTPPLRELEIRLAARRDEVVDTRRTLHARPELAFAEHATTTLIAERMRSLGLERRRCPTETGGVFALDGGRPGRTVLLRADIDGLPLDEEVDLPFRSRVAGVMHACGHDAHTAALLGVAGALADVAEELPGRSVFLFQPAEEQLSGARKMIDGGVHEGLGAQAVVGCHVTSVFPAGTVAMRPGIAMADGQGLRFSLSGAGGHGAIRQARGNVIRAAAELVRGLDAVIEGLTYADGVCACSAGVVHAGRASNVVPQRALVEGTLRTYTADQKTEALARLAALCERIRQDEGVEVQLEMTVHAPVVRNDPAATAIVRRAAEQTVGAARVLAVPPMPPSDDMSEFLSRIPGCYFFVGGARSDGTSGMHHTAAFQIDEEALHVEASVLARAAIDLAAGAARGENE